MGGGLAVMYYVSNNGREYHEISEQALEFDQRYVPALDALMAAYPSYVPVGELPLPPAEEGDEEEEDVDADGDLDGDGDGDGDGDEEGDEEGDVDGDMEGDVDGEEGDVVAGEEGGSRREDGSSSGGDVDEGDVDEGDVDEGDVDEAVALARVLLRNGVAVLHPDDA